MVPELHDVFRKRKGSFEKVMEGVKLCQKYKLKPIFNTVVHNMNMYTKGFIDLLEFTEKEKIMVNLLYAKGVGEFKDKGAMLSKEDFNNLPKILEPYNYWHIHHAGDLKANQGKQGCPGLKEMVNMTPYGDVIACANCHIYFGNVRDEPFKVIRERALVESPYGKYRKCFLAEDEDFINIYYPLLEKNGHVSLGEFTNELKNYELKHKKKVYEELGN